MADQEEQQAEQPVETELTSRATEESQASAQKGETTQERETPIEQIRQLKVRIEALEKELAEEREKATDYMNRAMRAQADLSNMRKRMQQEMTAALKEAMKPLIYEELAVLDNFDRAFMALPKEFEHFTWVEGIALIQTQLFGILHRAGITPIETIGKSYNPIEHEPVAYDETSNYPEDTVTAELQRGYKLYDQVLRPALVKLARAPQSVASGAGETAESGTTTSE